MREHVTAKNSQKKEASSEEEGRGTDLRQVKQQQALSQVRSQLRETVTTKYRETVMNSLLVFQQMVHEDDKEDLEEELDLSTANVVKDKLLDKLKDSAADGIKEGMELSARMSGLLAESFVAIKDQLSDISKTQQKIRIVDVIDQVVSAAYEEMEKYCEKAAAMIDALPQPVLVDVYRVLAQFRGVSDDDDSVDDGSLKEGLERWALEELMGLPQTGGAVAHDLAKEYYEVYESGVRNTMAVRNQVDDIQNDLGAPGAHAAEVDGKAKNAEKAIGPHMQQSVEKDQRLRARVESV